MRSLNTTLVGALVLLFLSSCDSTESTPETNLVGVWTTAPGINAKMVEVQQRDAAHITAGGANGVIYQSSDGGQTWTKRTSGLTEDIFRIERISDQLTLALGGNDILASNDDGVTWEIISSIDPIRRVRGIAVNGSDLFMVGTHRDGDDGSIYRSSDMGQSWDEVHYSHISGIYGISFFDELRGVAAGKLGRIYLTSDGGLSWAMQPSIVGSHQFTGVQAFPDGTAIAYGGSDDVAGFVYRSTNHGLTWAPTYEGTDRIERMSFTPETIKNGSGNNSGTIGGASTAVAVGDNGLMLRSNDAGRSWTPYTSLGDVRWRSVSVYANNRGIIVGENGAVALLSPAN